MYPIFAYCLIGLSLLNFSHPTAALGQIINVDAASRYWQLTDGLRQDKPITDRDWQDFVALPGNKTLIQNSFDSTSLHAYRQALAIVYMPQHAALLYQKLRDKVAPYWLINEYKQRESAFKAYLINTARNPRYLELMYSMAYAYLPLRAQTRVPALTIYYAALGDNATSQDEGIFFSLKAAVDLDKPKLGITGAHEMHHQLIPTLTVGPVAKEDKGLLWTLTIIRTEGIADLIDKTPQLGVANDSRELHGWLLDKAPQTVQKLDSIIQAMATAGSSASQSIRYYQKLMGGAGHMPGYYMARIIETNGYLKPLLAQIDNPFAFLRLYQQAAAKDPMHPPLFSAAALAYMARLEKKYVPPIR